MCDTEGIAISDMEGQVRPGTLRQAGFMSGTSVEQHLNPSQLLTLRKADLWRLPVKKRRDEVEAVGRENFDLCGEKGGTVHKCFNMSSLLAGNQQLLPLSCCKRFNVSRLLQLSCQRSGAREVSDQGDTNRGALVEFSINRHA